MLPVAVMALLIILARIIDVSMGTVRIIFISKGKKFISAAIGFFEVLIWIVAITQIMNNLTSPILYVAYAGGFALGTYLGILLEEKIAIGYVVFRIITQRKAHQLISVIKNAGYDVTVVDAKNKDNKSTHVIYVIIRRKDMPLMTSLVHNFNPTAFYSVEDVKSLSTDTYIGAKNKQASSLHMLGKAK